MGRKREPDLLGEWLSGGGPESDIVMSTRIRLARNVRGFPLKAKLASEDEALLYEHLKRRIDAARLAKDLTTLDLEELTEIQRLVLVERHLISHEHANGEGERGVVHDEAGSLALMLNEEDHLRIQVMVAGLRLDEAFERATKVDNRLQQKLEFAFHERFGFLTSCPTNVGTGMRVSVMLHLPALVFTKQIDKVFNAVSKMNLAVRGFYGEGTKALGDFYQISNQVTLGKAPEALLEDVKRVLPKIVSFEREVRNQVMRGDRVVVEDRVWRACGLLGHARSISSDEAFELLSMVRMGVHLGILGHLDIRRVNELFLLGQPGHLQTVQGSGQSLEPSERDALRATMIRQRLVAPAN
jgi:protein arginine kinase